MEIRPVGCRQNEAVSTQGHLPGIGQLALENLEQPFVDDLALLNTCLNCLAPRSPHFDPRRLPPDGARTCAPGGVSLRAQPEHLDENLEVPALLWRVNNIARWFTPTLNGRLEMH